MRRWTRSSIGTEQSLVERDGAILRLIYTFEAMWKASQQLLAEREGVEVASPNGAIRAARRVGWLSDEDAQAAITVGRDRDLAVHMYRGEIGAEIARRLAAHCRAAAPLARGLAGPRRGARLIAEPRPLERRAAFKPGGGPPPP